MLVYYHIRGCHGRDHMVVGLCNQCLSPLMLWVQFSIRARCTTLCDKICQWLATGQWFSPGSSPNKTEILLKVALNTIKQTNILPFASIHFCLIFNKCPWGWCIGISLAETKVLTMSSFCEKLLTEFWGEILFRFKNNLLFIFILTATVVCSPWVH